MKIWDNHSTPTQLWIKVVKALGIIALAFCLILPWTLLYIPAGVLWFLTLGHVNFCRLLTASGKGLSKYLPG